MKVTRTLQADVPPALAGVCKAMGFVRADLWRRYGALGSVGKNANTIRKEISAASLYDSLPVDGTIRAETTKDIVNDVLLYKAAALVKVRQAVAARTQDAAERKRLFTALKSDDWLADNFLHRQMRKHFRHGTTEKSQVLTRYSNQVHATGKARNQLHALEKKHRKAGNIAKADRIKTCNLGRKKIDARKDKAQKQLRTIAYKAMHSIIDKAAVLVSEDLTSPIASKVQWRQYNRKMSAWAKGVLAQSLDTVATQRGAKHVLVNAAYTSQMDSSTGLLQGKRVGDKFYRENGDVLQADHNAALNVLARLDDGEITRFTPYKEVRQILLARSPALLSVNRLELGAQARQPSADKS